MGRPRKQDAGDTREKILGSSLQLFAAHSFHGTSMREVAKAVGVRESALYHHFPSKDAIMAALMERYGPGRAVMMAKVDVPRLDELGLRRYLRQLVHALFESWYQPTDLLFARMMISEGVRQGLPAESEPRQALGNAYLALRGLFERLMKEKTIRSANSDVLVFEFTGPLLMMRLFHQLLRPKPTPLSKLKPLLDEHVENFCRLVSTKP